METTMQIETLQEALENGLEIRATYAPNGEIVELQTTALRVQVFISEEYTRFTVRFQDGTESQVALQDLIDFTW